MIDVVIWYIWAQVFAFCGLLVTAQWLRPLPDRGYGLSKAFGLLLGGFLYWIIVTLGLARNEPGAVLMALVLVAAIGLILRWHYGFASPVDGQNRRRKDYPITRDILPAIVTVEVLFAVSFILCAVYRAYNPEIVEAGGEKFMESMYINAILRSPTFPPNDAWLAGFSISYYYFGYILVAMVTKISGVLPGIGFNLGGAHFFALTLTSAFSVGYNLWAAYRGAGEPPSESRGAEERGGEGRGERGRAIVAGLLTACMLGIMGNMGGFMESVRCTNLAPTSFWKWLDVRALDTKPVECAGIVPTRFYWWWDWSRVIHDYTPVGTDQEVITEMPSFSFILGDNHPHVMNLPFVLLAVGIALFYLTRQEEKPAHPPGSERQFSLDGLPPLKWFTRNAPDILVTAFVLGGLSFMNTWDFPVYGAVVIGAILIRRWTTHDSLLPAIIQGAAFFVVGYLLYLPFYSTFASQARGIGVNLFNGTRFIQFFMMFAPLLVTLVIHIARSLVVQKRLGGTAGIPLPQILKTSLGLLAGCFVIGLLALVMIAVVSPTIRGYVTEFTTTGNIMGVTRDTITSRLLTRISDPWVVLLLAICASLAATLILTRPLSPALLSSPPLSRSPAPLIDKFVLLLFLGGMLLTLAVEFIFLQDLFGTRMNTVFKFYYQAWTVWAIAAAFGLMALSATPGIGSKIGLGVVGALILAGMLYPLYAAFSKAGGFTSKPTLDGSAYLLQARPEDAKLIEWLNINVRGAPVIVESPGDHYAAYQYNGRISAFTGLPTLLGWGGHEHQWRGNYDEPARREPLIETLYNTTDTTVASQILRQFNVSYVIVGQQELSRYTPEGLAKFTTLCRIAHQAGQSIVYQCG